MLVQQTGSFAVYSSRDGSEVTPKGRKTRALLAFLVSHVGTKFSKTRLADLLWSNRGDAQARASLRQSLLELRRAVNVEEEIVSSDREHIWVASGCLAEDGVKTDARQDAFEDLDHISPEFDDWLAEERSRRVAVYIADLKAKAEQLLGDDCPKEALLVIDQIQIADGCDEDALRLGMRADFESGHAAPIVDRYRTAEARLSADFGVLPSRESRALRDHLLSLLNARPEAESNSETEREMLQAPS